MGEKICTLGTIRINSVKFEVELNQSPSSSLPQQIHIQSSKARMEMNVDEFHQAVAAVRLAAEKLRRVKKLV